MSLHIDMTRKHYINHKDVEQTNLDDVTDEL